MRRAAALTTLAALLLVPFHASATASGDEIDGGAAATQATEVEPGTTYLEDVAPGEARWFSVEVMTAQDYGVTLTEYGETEYNCCLSVTWYDSDYDRDMGDQSFNSEGTAKTYRVASDDGVDEDGTRYLEIRLDEDASNRPVTFEFVVDVTGEGAPTESESPTESPSEEPAADETDADADADGDADTETEAAAADTDDDGGSTMLWVVLGLLALLVLLLLAVVVLLMMRMRKANAPATSSTQPPADQA